MGALPKQPRDAGLPPRMGRPARPYLPPLKAWQGAAMGAALGAFATLIFMATRLDSRLGTLGDVVLVLIGGALLGAAGWAVAAGLLLLAQRMPLRWAAGVGGALVAAVAGVALLGLPVEALLAGLVLVLPPAVLGGAVGLVADRGFRSRGAVLFLAAAVALVGADGYWLGNPGATAPAAMAGLSQTQPPAIAAPDPGAPGAYAVRTTTYGSGKDLHRPEYGAKVGVRTDPVDGSPFLTGWDRLRTFYWGFDAHKLPVNGRVWYPAGEGPFPLVLVVHGNHAMTDDSDGGYAWLGELLASRGYVVASVDENFLNAGLGVGDLERENGARAWLLLQHLEAFQRWNATVGTPFFRRVDMASIALIGHSRGGEAAALAAAFNDLPYFPDNASIPFDFRFKIKAVAAMAPTDGQYQPSDKPVGLTGVSYLLLQGAADADVTSYQGSRQFRRVQLGEGTERFKAAVYIGGANHGQFNTSWGRYDWSDLGSLLINARPVIDGAAQRRAAAVYLSAFLDATLRGEQAYVPLFQDARAGAAWLPETTYVTQFEDSSFKLLASYEEDLDVLTTTAPGGAARGENLKTWRETEPQLRKGEPAANTAVELAWKQEGDKVAQYSLSFPDNLARAWNVGPGAALTFALADSREPAAHLPPLDVTVELVTADGTAARLPLSRWAPIPVREAPKLYKLGALEFTLFGKPAPVFQTYTLPLSDFAAGAPFDPAAVRTIRFRFDRVKEGAVLLDDVGFRTSLSANTKH